MKRISLHVHASTLYEMYAPAEEFARAVAARTGRRPAPAWTPPDAYALRLFSAWHPRVEAAYDLAGAGTDGGSAALWAGWADGPRARVVGAGDEPWAADLKAHLAAAGRPEPDWVAPAALADDLRREPGQPLVTFGPAGAGEDPVALAERVVAGCPAAVVFLPVGPVGTDPHVERLLGWARRADRRVTLLRDLDPALAKARGAFVAPAADADTPAVLARIARLFAGNLDLLALARQSFVLTGENEQLRTDARRLTHEQEAERKEREAEREEWETERKDREHRAYLNWKEAYDAYQEILTRYQAVAAGGGGAVARRLRRVRAALAAPAGWRGRLGALLGRAGRVSH